MNGLAVSVLDAARSRLNEPYINHFNPNNCEGGAITTATCMESGMDGSGYDCSGLVVASLCEVLGIKTTDWPANLRHVAQFEQLAAPTDAQFADVLLFDSMRPDGTPYRTHCGLYTGPQCVVHSTGRSKRVVEGTVETTGVITDIRVVPLRRLVEKALQ